MFTKRGHISASKVPDSQRGRVQTLPNLGVDVIGMTLFPEVALAREAEICYISISMITDYDVWAEKPVSTMKF